MPTFDLTPRLIRESKSNGKDTILFDKSPIGFGLGIHPSAARSTSCRPGSCVGMILARTSSTFRIRRPVRAPVPLGKAAQAHVAAMSGPCDPEAFLFPGYAEGRGQSSLVACWRAVCADAGLGRLRLHDLRHTAASQAVMAGENLLLVGKLLGHRRHRTTAGYAHLVEAAEKVGSLIAHAMRGGGGESHRPPSGTAPRHAPGSSLW